MTFVVRCTLFSDWKRAQIERVEEWESVGAFDAVYVPSRATSMREDRESLGRAYVHLRKDLMRRSRTGPRNAIARQKMIRLDALRRVICTMFSWTSLFTPA